MTPFIRLFPVKHLLCAQHLAPQSAGLSLKFPLLTVSSCVTSGWPLALSEPHVSNENNSTPLTRLSSGRLEAVTMQELLYKLKSCAQGKDVTQG